jgi:hypothetical protein
MFWGFSRNDAGSGSNTRDEAVKAFETVVGRRSMARPDWRLQDLLSKATRNSYHSLPGGSRFYAGESRLVTDLGAPDRQQFTYPSKAEINQFIKPFSIENCAVTSPHILLREVS